MPFSKRFPRKSKTSAFPVWEDVSLTPEEEMEMDELSRQENIKIMSECLLDAKTLSADKWSDEGSTVRIAVALFNKRASHSVWWKERKAKEKFDALNKANEPSRP